MPFGKYKGYPLEEINPSYLEWLIEHIPLKGPLQGAVISILNQKEMMPIERSIDLARAKQVYRRLSLKYHPDHGGSHLAQVAINEFYEELVT